MLSLLLALAAIGVPLVGVAVLLLADSGSIVAGAGGFGLTLAVIGIVLAAGGYVAGRRESSTAMPIIGGLASVFVAVGFLVAQLFF